MSAPLIQLSEVSLGFGKHDIFKNIDLVLNKGERPCLVGRNGSGKSTLLNILGTLDSGDKGTIHINGVNTSKMNDDQLAEVRCKHIGFVFQYHHLIPELSALENVVLPQLIFSGDDNPKKAKEIIDFLGLSERMSHFPSQLSGGEMSRISVARALINSPKIVLADEPSGNLDHSNASNLIELFKSVSNEFDQSIIIATHDPSVASIGKRKFVLDNGLLSLVDSV